MEIMRKSVFLMLLLCSLCQAAPQGEVKNDIGKSTLRKVSDPNQQIPPKTSSGWGVWKLIKKCGHALHNFFLGDDGIFKDIYYSTGDPSPTKKKGRICRRCCCCRCGRPRPGNNPHQLGPPVAMPQGTRGTTSCCNPRDPLGRTQLAFCCGYATAGDGGDVVAGVVSSHGRGHGITACFCSGDTSNGATVDGSGCGNLPSVSCSCGDLCVQGCAAVCQGCGDCLGAVCQGCGDCLGAVCQGCGDCLEAVCVPEICCCCCYICAACA